MPNKPPFKKFILNKRMCLYYTKASKLEYKIRDMRSLSANKETVQKLEIISLIMPQYKKIAGYIFLRERDK